jgi:hypothetical protein
MNNIQNYGIEFDAEPSKTNNFIRLGFIVVFIIAVAIVPSVATVNFFFA